MRISHEAIYQALFVQGRGALRRELTACLRTGRALRVPRARTRARGTGFNSDEVLIRERPAEADDRAVPGHWEGDLIIGLDSSAIAGDCAPAGATSVVQGLGSLRDNLSDAHGQGKDGVKPLPRHAELAVNLSGAIASFLVATYQARMRGSQSCGSVPRTLNV